jgi:hypothetical protein
MKKLLITASILILSAFSAQADSTLAIGTGFNFGHVTTNAGALTAGTAAAGSVATGHNTSLGSGFAVATPAGGLSAGVGASAGQSNSASGAFSIGNGAAITAGNSTNVGAGVGIGFTNVTP